MEIKTESPTLDGLKETLDKLEEAFEDYKKEYQKLEAIADAFEAQNQRLSERLEIFEMTAKQCKNLAESDDLESIKKLLKEVKV